MGICPYCKQHLDFRNVEMEKKGRGIADQESMYMCPFCNYILDFLMQYDN